MNLNPFSTKKRKATTILAAILTVFVLTAADCDGSGDDGDGGAKKQEEKNADQQLSQYLISQPVPQFNWSQLRQNLIEIQTAQANGTATTSFFFNQGIPDPIHACPSIGFAIPATYQLTNPDQITNVDTPGEGGTAVTTGQLEATGVYTADTTGTSVICIDDKGEGYAFYWEGFVSTVAGPAKWNVDTRQVELTGKPTGDFTTEEGK